MSQGQSKFRQLIRDGLVWNAESERYIQHGYQPAHTTTDIGVRFGVPEIDSVLPRGCLPPGTCHEWFPVEDSPHAAGFAVPPSMFLTLLATKALVASGPCSLALWIGRDCWPSPFFLHQALTAYTENTAQTETADEFFNRCIFLDVRSYPEQLKALETALRSLCVASVVAGCEAMPFSLSRRLGLAAKKGNTLGLLVKRSGSPQTISAAYSRWAVSLQQSSSDNPRFLLRLLAQKASATRCSEWLLTTCLQRMELRIDSKESDKQEQVDAA